MRETQKSKEIPFSNLDLNIFNYDTHNNDN